MILCDYINEQQFVHSFIQETLNKSLLVDGILRRWFVWGAEIWLPEGGRDGFSGALDIIASDDQGDVWLVEAKLCTNPELSAPIWSKQLLPYRYGLSRLSVDIINRRSRRFLVSEGAFQGATFRLNYECKHLFDAFRHWVKEVGLDSNTAAELYNKTMHSIKTQNVISAVLADTYNEEVWNSRPRDGKAYAYILAENGDAGLDIRIRLDKAKDFVNESAEDFAANVREWKAIARDKQTVKPTPDSVEVYLTNASAQYYRECIQLLKAHGWSGKYKSNSKAFIIDLPTRYGPDIRIHLGWVDFDARVPMTNRLLGELGLKFNIDFRHFKNNSYREIGYSLAKRLAKEANYNGRGKGRHLQSRDLTIEEQESWDWEMYRWISPSDRDYLGNPQERADFEAAWHFLVDILESERVTI